MSSPVVSIRSFFSVIALLVFLSFVTDATVGQTTEVNGDDGLVYIAVPAGSFQMGCSPGDTVCQSDERPRHEVAISRSFYIGRTETTVGAYLGFVKATGHRMPKEPSVMGISLNLRWKDLRQPMVNLSWREAQTYWQWAGGRLPTEAEWEYSARAGEEGPRYGRLNKIAWAADNTGGPIIDSKKIWDRDAEGNAGRYLQLILGYGRRIPRVGQKLPNNWGLFDMLGSVYEWTQDWYQSDYYRHANDVDPVNRTQTPLRVTRGGCWGNVPDYLRLSARSWGAGDSGVPQIGFRCVLPAATGVTGPPF